MSPPQSPLQPHLDSLQVFRGIAALWVLLFHVGVISTLRLGHDVLGPFIFAGRQAVSFFFVLSGFIITYVHWKHLGDASNVRPYLSRRLSRIYPPVFIIVSVKLLFIAVTGTGTESKELTPGVTFSSLFLIPAPVYLIDVLWTLVFEVLFYFLFSIAIAFGKRTAVTAGIAWTAFVLGRCLLGYPQEYGSFAGIIGHPFCLLFLMGAVSARIIANPKWMPRLGWLWIPGVVVMVFCIWYFDLPGSVSAGSDTFNLLDVLLWGAASVMIILSAASVEQRNGLRWPGWLCQLGDASYSIYLVHTSVMMVVVAGLRHFRINLDAWLTVVLTGIGLVSLAGSLAFWKWVELPVMNWWKKRILPVMSGGRKLRSVSSV